LSGGGRNFLPILPNLFLLSGQLPTMTIVSNFSRQICQGKGLVSVSVEQQLSTLRRWLTALTVVTVFLAIAVFVLSSTRFEHIRAHRIELVNSQGKTAAVLGVSPSDGGVLLIYDANGTLRIAVGMTTRGNAAIDLNDANGNQWVTIQVSSDGTVTMKGLK
jgi:hypothetical protein